MVVSTDVGGIPEVLPPHMILLSKPDAQSNQHGLVDFLVLLERIEEAITLIETHPIHAEKRHLEVSQLYSWENVAIRTEIIYDQILKDPPDLLIDRCQRFYGVGFFSGILSMMIVIFDWIVYQGLECFFPRHWIEKAPTSK
jgi:phosphatidylinositol glycan class A protein